MPDLSGPEPSFDSWQELVALLATRSAPEWIYRGLPNYTYEPVSKLERTLVAADVPRGGQWRDAENRAIGFFKLRARRVLPATPDDGDLLGWLSLMQHYGAPTRLIDWTASPFVACYFAYERPDPDRNDGALWLLHAGACRSAFPSKFYRRGPRDHTGTESVTTFRDDAPVAKSYPARDLTTDALATEENEFLRDVIEHETAWPLPLPIVRPDARMVAQQACFVCLGKLGSEPPVLPFLMNTGGYAQGDHGCREGEHGMWIPNDAEITVDAGATIRLVSRPIPEPPGRICKKIRLRYEWRDQALATLARLNITADTLFPGLDGIGRATEVHLLGARSGVAFPAWDDLLL